MDDKEKLRLGELLLQFEMETPQLDQNRSSPDPFQIASIAAEVHAKKESTREAVSIALDIFEEAKAQLEERLRDEKGAEAYRLWGNRNRHILTENGKPWPLRKGCELLKVMRKGGAIDEACERLSKQLADAGCSEVEAKEMVEDVKTHGFDSSRPLVAKTAYIVVNAKIEEHQYGSILLATQMKELRERQNAGREDKQSGNGNP